MPRDAQGNAIRPERGEIVKLDVPEFSPFPKIPRLNRKWIITEKIDGTNASIYINGDVVVAGSRTRWITPQDDNFGFAAWVEYHKPYLIQRLGDGHHFGEWWGKGIQRGYGLDERRFSLFNTSRWSDIEATNEDYRVQLYCVPVLFECDLMPGQDYAIQHLAKYGSVAAPGFDRPEGIVLYHTASNSSFKVLCENDDQPKGSNA